MNVLVFYTRLVLGAFLTLFFAIDFRKGDNITAWAGVAVAVALWSSLVPVFFRRQKLLPLSSLKSNFNRLQQLAWARAFFGFMFAFSGIGNIYANKQAAGIGLVSLGVFLLSPFSNWVFSYNNQPSQEPGMARHWDRSMTRLAIIRTLGLMVFLLGIGAYIGNDIGLGRVLVIVGLMFVFIRQIDVLFKHK